MTGLECYTSNGWLQLSDKVDALGFLKKAENGESNTTIGNENYAEVHGKKGRYFFAPISQLTLPVRNYGLEIYDDNGELRFSTAMNLLSFAEKFYLDVAKNKDKPYVFNGLAGHQYGVMYLKNQARQHYRYKNYIPPMPPDEGYWEFVVYLENFKVEYRTGGLTLKYSFEEEGYSYSEQDPGSWDGPPPIDRRVCC